jgi:hypothetical protein
MPDQTQGQFPDDMPADQIRGLIQQKFPEETSQLSSSGTDQTNKHVPDFRALFAPTETGPDFASLFAPDEPTAGVTIAPKGGTPREATPEEAQPYWRASVLPLALNQNTGRVEAALPNLISSALNAAALPGDVYAGRTDPKSDEGFKRAMDLAGLMVPDPSCDGRGNPKSLGSP